MPESGADILARIQPRLAEDWVEIVFRPDLLAEHEELESELDDLQEQIAVAEAKVAVGPKRNSDKPDAALEALREQEREKAAQIKAVEDEMAASAVPFRFRALPRDKFRNICDAHPPRKDDQFDLAVGYHRADVGDELVRASLVDPAFDEASWAEFLDVISIGEWNRLRARAEKVNGQQVTEAPKSLLASRVLSPRAND